MPADLAHFLSPPAAREALAVQTRLCEAGHTAYFVGGALRDHLLGHAPKDYDLATSAGLDQVLALFPHAHVVGRAFGTCLIPHSAGACEVASFREDGPYLDGRRPSTVRPASPEADAARRDFTINALFYDPQRERLIDYVGGSADLDARLLRAIGHARARFQEDALRLFRAPRFAARTGFAIEAATWDAMRDLAPLSANLAPERVEQELTRLLLDKGRAHGVLLLGASGLLDIWLPEVMALVGLAQPARFHPEGCAFTHTLLALDALNDPDAELAWGTLLHDIGKAVCATTRGGIPFFPSHAARGAEWVEAIAERFRFSGKRREEVRALVELHMRPLDYEAMRLSTRRKLFARPDFPRHLALWEADAKGCLNDAALAARIAADYAADDIALAPPLLSGRDLLDLGFAPGREVGATLALARDAQLDGTLRSREEALDFARVRLAKARRIC